MSAFLDETGTLITVSSSNPLPVGSKTAPSNVKIQTGWIVEKPEFEKMNWVKK